MIYSVCHDITRVCGVRSFPGASVPGVGGASVGGGVQGAWKDCCFGNLTIML